MQRVTGGELGITGTANYSGDILAESNAALTYQQAYGSVGSRTWGEWEKLRRTNPFVSMALDFVAAPIRDARLDVKPAVSDELPEDVAQAHADFVSWNLNQHCDPPPSELLSQMAQNGLNDGFSLHELVWETVTHKALPGGIGNGLKKLAERLPSTLVNQAWNEVNGELVSVKQRGPGNGARWVVVELPAEKLSLFSWKRSGGNYQGFSVWRSVWYIAKIQEELLKLVGISLTREGAGIPTAVSTSDRATSLNDKQRRALSKLLQNLVYHENAAVVMPQGWDIKWVFSPGANKGHVIDAWHQLGTVILQIVGAQQLVLGVNGTGSRSVGQTHNAQSMVFVQGVVSAIESCVNGVAGRRETGIVRKLIDANFGPQPAYPQVTLTLKKPQQDPKDQMTAVGLAVTSGTLTVTADDENQVREVLGLSPIDPKVRDEERAKAQAAKVAAAPKFMPGQPPGAPPAKDPDADQEPDPKDPNEAKEPPEPKEMTRLAATAPFVPSRPLRPSEKKLDLQRMSDFLNNARGEFERAVRPIVVGMLAKAAPAIHKAMADGKPHEVASIPLDTAKLSKAIAAFLETARAEGAKQVRAELKNGTGAKVAKERSEGIAATRLGSEEEKDDHLPESDPTEDTDALLEAQRLALVKRMENRIRSNLEQSVIDAERTGGTSDDVVDETLADQLDTGAFRSDAGSVLTKAWNGGRDEAARLMGGVDTVEYSAILDGRGCSDCQEMDGKTAPFDSPEHDAMVPPNRDCQGGDNCRCTLVFLTGEDDGSDE